MVCVHNCLLRSLNAIHYYAPIVQSVDYAAFIGFARTWHKGVAHHHSSEEAYFFKQLQVRFGAEAMVESQREHEAFHAGLDRFAAYLTDLTGRESAFEGAKLLEIIDEFAAVFVRHLHNEIPAILDLDRYGDVEAVGEIWDQAVKAGIGDVKLADFFDEIPFIAATHDVTFEGGLHQDFPPMPKVVFWFIRNVLAQWNGQFWKFAPCHLSGIPKEAPEVGN
jgi:hemerythrin-like domain-containing protein